MGLRGPKPKCECGTCSACLRRARELRWRRKTPEKQRAYRAARAEYQKEWRNRNRERRSADRLARWRDDVGGERAKARARQSVLRAVAAGSLVRQPCEVCGTDERVQAHHDDYSRPLDVRWLCTQHHAEQHTVAT